MAEHVNCVNSSISELTTGLSSLNAENKKIGAETAQPAQKDTEVNTSVIHKHLRNLIQINDLESLQSLRSIEHDIEYLFDYPLLDIRSIIERQARLILSNGFVNVADQKLFGLFKDNSAILYLHRDTLSKHAHKIRSLTKTIALVGCIDLINRSMFRLASAYDINKNIQNTTANVLFNSSINIQMQDIVEHADLDTLESVYKFLSELDRTRHLVLSYSDFEVFLVYLIGRLFSYRQVIHSSRFTLDELIRTDKLSKSKKSLKDAKKTVSLISLMVKINENELKNLVDQALATTLLFK